MSSNLNFLCSKATLKKGLIAATLIASAAFMSACSSSNPTDGSSPKDLVREARVAKVLEQLHQKNSAEVASHPSWTDENERNYINAIDSTDLIYDENTDGFIKQAPKPIGPQVVSDTDEESNVNNQSSVKMQADPSSNSSTSVTANATKQHIMDTEKKAGVSLKEAVNLAKSHQLNIDAMIPKDERKRLYSPPAPLQNTFTSYSERKDDPDPNLRRLPDERDYPLQPFKNPLYYDNTPGTYHYRTYRQYNSGMESQQGARAGKYYTPL